MENQRNAGGGMKVRYFYHIRYLYNNFPKENYLFVCLFVRKNYFRYTDFQLQRSLSNPVLAFFRILLLLLYKWINYWRQKVCFHSKKKLFLINSKVMSLHKWLFLFRRTFSFQRSMGPENCFGKELKLTVWLNFIFLSIDKTTVLRRKGNCNWFSLEILTLKISKFQTLWKSIEWRTNESVCQLSDFDF